MDDGGSGWLGRRAVRTLESLIRAEAALGDRFFGEALVAQGAPQKTGKLITATQRTRRKGQEILCVRCAVAKLAFDFNYNQRRFLTSSGFPLLHAHLAVPTTASGLALFFAQRLAFGHEKALTAMIAELTTFAQLTTKTPEEIFQPVATFAFWTRHPFVTPSRSDFSDLGLSRGGFFVTEHNPPTI